MIKVYFESGSHAELVAVFVDEETYDVCLPALEKFAKVNRMIVTESVNEEIELEDLIDPKELKPIMKVTIVPYDTWMGVFWLVRNSETKEVLEEDFESTADAEMYCRDNNFEYELKPKL